MISLESIIEILSDKELQDAFEELKEWRKTSVLRDGIVRETHNQLEMTNGTNIPITAMTEPFLWEMARRNYNEIHSQDDNS